MNSSFEIDSLSNGTNSTGDVYFYQKVKYGVGLWLCILTIIGCPTNLFAAKCAWNLARSRNKSPSQLYQWFVVSMSIADCLFLAVVCPAQFLRYSMDVTPSRQLCLTVYVVSHSTTVASSLNLLALNVDKFLAIYRPLLHVHCLNGWRVFAVVVSSWFVSAAWALVFVYGPMVTYEEPCLFRVKTYAYYLVFAVVFFIAPTVMATTLSVFIAVVVKRHVGGTSYSSRKKLVFATAANQSKTDVSLRRRSVGSAPQRDSLLTARWITFVFTTTVWSFCTTIPYRIIFSVMEQNRGGNRVLFVLAMASFCFMAANPAGNAIITILTQRRFREEAKRMWKKFYAK